MDNQRFINRHGHWLPLPIVDFDTGPMDSPVALLLRAEGNLRKPVSPCVRQISEDLVYIGGYFKLYPFRDISTCGV
jgi:hypothetical protein